MLHKFYVVVDDPAYKEEIHQELVAEAGHETIPSRPVEVINPMPLSEYNSVVLLTQDEADALISDLRIKHVERDPKELGVIKRHTGIRTGVWSKSTTAVNTHKNWGLVRSINTRDTFTTGSGSTTTNYTFNLDGTGVDVVIMDNGVEPNHPEFAVNADGTGGSRVVDLDWTLYGVSSTPIGGFMGDCEGHGTHVASTAAGNTCGWAPGAKIYSLRTVGTGAATEYDITDGRQLGLIDDFEAWQALRTWHNSKPVDPTTGYKRPTIVNCSFGFFYDYLGVSSITYRGTTYTVSTTTAAYGTIGVPEGGTGVHGFRYTALEAEIASTIAAGVIVVAAAGNDRHKIDIPGGLDYNNYWTSSYYGSSFYYHRGPTPAGATNVITVGCIASFTQATSTPEHKRNFSNCGPRVDIWAPGDYIMAGYSSVGAISDPRNSAYYLAKISGTSMSSPQVTGALALTLQARPWMNQAQCRAYVTATASTWLVNENFYGGSGYTNFGSLQSGPALALYQQFNLPNPLTITG